VLAFRAARELATPDPFTPLVLEGLALELSALAERARHAPARPAWLEAARDYMRERFRVPPTVGEVAAVLDVQADVLSRTFRARYGEGLGEYARRVRLEWAASRLAATELPLARVAAEAGFADQSHFTRAFKTWAGLTPAAYRAALSQRASFFSSRRLARGSRLP
jgi:AraC family transcriptional regulator